MPRRLPQLEFTILLALTFAMVAFSIDAMLPGLPLIAADLSPDDPNKAQFVLTSFMLGLGLGTLVSGPISDQFGRKPIILLGLGIYAIGALISAAAQSLEMLLFGRALQGLGAAFPRTVGVALIRDLYQGRNMAKITSFVMTIFMLAPAAAPTIGAILIKGMGWRGVFVSFIVLASVVTLWLTLRQEETLPKENRRKITYTLMKQGVVEVLGTYNIRIYIAMLILGFGQMFAVLSSIQQIYDEVFNMAETFPLWFGSVAILAAVGALINGKFVERVGMHFMIRLGFGLSLGGSVIALLLVLSGLDEALGIKFAVFYIWTVALFLINSFTFGNINALALQPLGHIAGLANSLMGAFFTTGMLFIAAPIGQMFNGTTVPVMTAGVICSGLALILFYFEDSATAPHNAPPKPAE
ncbi:multidrug effflux MFS transporter [Celeribacter sp.]|uniref:multidrug effflux MFS transporter n=1 Tax=Celeribacter sp. TaxID=1890673 RepID=UPI003A91E24A